MLEVNFSPFPILVTDRLILRQVWQEDAPEMFFLRSDARILKYISREPPTSIDEIHTYIQFLTDNADNNTGITWGITLKNNDKVIGTIALWRLIKEHYRAEIGYIMNPEFYGKGIMHEAMVVVADYAFNVMGLHSIEANTHSANIESQRVLERAGYIREAYFRESWCYKGVFSDRMIYSLIVPKNNA